MKGTVQVVKKSSKAPSKADDAKTIKKQSSAAAKLAKQLLSEPPPAGNVVNVGNDKKGINSLAFFPSTKTIHAGESVTFQMPGSRPRATTWRSARSRTCSATDRG